MAKFDINDIRKVLGWGSQKAPALIDDVLEEAGPLVNRVSSEAAEVAPQVIGKGTRTAGKVADAIDADFTDVGEAVKKKPQMADMALLGLGGVAGGAMMLGSGDDEQPPVPPMAPKPIPEPQAPEQILPNNYMDLANEEAGDPQYVPEAPSIQPRQPAAAPVEQAPIDQEVDFVRMLEAAQREASGNRNSANMLRSSELLGAGLARITPEHGSSKIAMDQAGQPVEDVKAKFGAYKEQSSFDKARSEMNDEKKMRDPNSEVSRLTTELAVKAGLIKPGQMMSAMALKSSGVNLGNLLSTIEAGKARAEASALQREAMGASKESSNKLKIQGSVDRQVTQLLKSKDMEAYNAAQDAIFALDSAMESDDDKIKGGAAFMQYAKIAQGDNSVVRDGDMAQLAGRYNYTSVGDMFNKLKARASGGNFGSIELAAMKEVAALTKKIKERRVKELMSPIIKRTGAAGLDITESLDPAMVERFGPSDEKQGLTTPPASKTIKVRRISDGVVKELPEASAAKMDKSKYEIL
jgi:hypothetical protein